MKNTKKEKKMTAEEMRKMFVEQRAWEYILYMMISSYCKKSMCISTFWEERLKIYYDLLEDKQQIAMENKAINLIENLIKKKAPDDFWNSTVYVEMFFRRNRGLTEIRMSNGSYVFCVSSQYHLDKGSKRRKVYIRNYENYKTLSNGAIAG